MDVSSALEKLVPAAEYGGSLTANDQESFDALRWDDNREKPTWSDILTAMTPTPAEQLAEERANMRCSRKQGKLAIGPTTWAATEQLLVDMEADPEVSPTTVWALKVAVYDAQEWQRNDPDMQALIWAMNLTDEQADDLFRLAMTL